MTDYSNTINKKSFSLLELSISIFIMSVIVSMSIVALTSYNKSSLNEKNERILAEVRQAVRTYFLKHNRLPCPADPTLDVYNTSFGSEYLDSTGVGCSGAQLRKDNRLKVQIKQFITRETELVTFCESDSVNCSGKQYHLWGGIPTRELGLPAKYAFDAFGKKIDYFVDDYFANFGRKSTLTCNTSYDSLGYNMIYINKNGNTSSGMVRANWMLVSSSTVSFHKTYSTSIASVVRNLPDIDRSNNTVPALAFDKSLFGRTSDKLVARLTSLNYPRNVSVNEINGNSLSENIDARNAVFFALISHSNKNSCHWSPNGNRINNASGYALNNCHETYSDESLINFIQSKRMNNFGDYFVYDKITDIAKDYNLKGLIKCSVFTIPGFNSLTVSEMNNIISQQPDASGRNFKKVTINSNTYFCNDFGMWV